MEKEKLKLYLDAPLAVIPGHLIKIDDRVERPVAIVSATGGTAGPKTGRKLAKDLVKRYNEYPELIEALENAIKDCETYSLTLPFVEGARALIAQAKSRLTNTKK